MAPTFGPYRDAQSSLRDVLDTLINEIAEAAVDVERLSPDPEDASGMTFDTTGEYVRLDDVRDVIRGLIQ